MSKLLLLLAVLTCSPDTKETTDPGCYWKTTPTTLGGVAYITCEIKEKESRFP